MKMRCPQCGVKGSADDAYLGRKVKCPKCQEVFILTDAGDEVEAPEVSPVALEESAPIASVSQDSLPEVEEDEAVTEESEEIEEDLFGDLSVDEEVADEEPQEDSGEVEAEEAVESFFDNDSEDEPAAEQPEESLSIDDFFADEEEVKEEDTLKIDDLEEPAISEEVAEEEPIDESPAVEELITEDEQEENILLEEEDELELTEPSGEEVAESDEAPVVEQLEDSEAILIEEEDELILDEELAAELEDEQVEKTEVISAPVAALEGDEKKEKKSRKEAVKPEFTLENLTVFGAIKEAWKYTKGAKLTLLLATLVVTVLSAGLNALVITGLPFLEGSVTGMFPGSANVALGWISGLSLFLASFLSSVFGAGLVYMGVKRVADQPISVGMVFSGLPRILAIFFGFLFMTLMIISGLVLLVLPGIYLAVGYTLTLPLIIDKKMQPWEAMETSRKAIHKVWWTVFGIFIVMGILFNVAMIPLGLGLIWAIPMYVIVFGVIYRALFKE